MPSNKRVSKDENMENNLQPDLWSLYRLMLKSRLFEKAVARLWKEGKISGEMHLGVGEEAIAAGIVQQLQEGDAMALDHRGTPPLLMRGVDPVLLLREFLGRPDGLCSGMGGHMHLFSPQHLAASSGIVGAAGPAAAGFALAAQYLRPGSVAIAFFGEGAMNQGMLMEAMNLASAWKLPVLFVCKDNRWAITTSSPAITGGNLLARAQGFGLRASEADGGDAVAVWNAANEHLEGARLGNGPAFLLAHCTHLEGHFLGDPLLDMARKPFKSLRQWTWPLLRSFIRRKGVPMRQRVRVLRTVLATIAEAQNQPRKRNDPVQRARLQLIGDARRLNGLEAEVKQEIQQIVELALKPVE
jgi:TPP-dependent pyruvate/acetoin dehydrogenase alpha subunit